MARKTVKNNIVTPELWSKVSIENKDLLNEFIDYCKSQDMAHGTIDGYENDIKICWVWNVQNNDNKFFIDFTKKDIMKYQNYLINVLKLGSSRVRRLKATLSSMSNYIENILDEEYKNYRNIIKFVKSPAKQEVREKTILTDEQVDFILNYLVEKKQFQQACGLALAVSSGARKAEILRFKVSYFVDENIKYGALYKTPEKIKTKGRTSRGKMINRYVLVNKFKPYFDLWMEQRKELGIYGDEIFFTNYGSDQWTPANESLLNSWASTFSHILNIDFYWHSCRHYFTTALCKANVPNDVIKDIIGWDSVSMISIYNDSDIDEEISKYFNEDGIKKTEKKSLNELG